MTVRVSIEDKVATLTLDDPARRNCVSAAMSLAVRDAVHGLPREVQALVLTAEGPAFSAGGDVDTLTRRDVPLSVLYEGFQALSGLPIPTLAVVDGPAVGAGLNWALACDVIIAGPHAVFDPRFLDIGIHPGGGHQWRLTNRVGRMAAAALVLFGDKLTGEEAQRVGLAWRCVPEPVVFAQSLARRAAQRPAELVRRTKATLDVAPPTEQIAIDIEQRAQEWSMKQDAFVEGVAALRRRLEDR
jgi:enoyl-CoA hydratase